MACWAVNRAHDKFPQIIRGFDLERARAPVCLAKADNVNFPNEFPDMRGLDVNSVAVSFLINEKAARLRAALTQTDEQVTTATSSCATLPGRSPLFLFREGKGRWVLERQ